MAMNPVNNDTFESAVLGDDSLKLMFVGAPWCGHCQSMKPFVMEYSQEHPEVNICFADADESPDLMTRLEITSIPTVFVFKDRKEVFRKVGAMTKNEIADLVASHS